MQEGNDGYVSILFEKHTTLFHFDRKVFFRTQFLYNHCWPARSLSSHGCCPPRSLVWLLKPIGLAAMGKEARARHLVHDVPPSEIVETLSSYGITKDVLPTQMGGSVQLNPSEWIANRRAIEMEEIA